MSRTIISPILTGLVTSTVFFLLSGCGNPKPESLDLIDARTIKMEKPTLKRESYSTFEKELIALAEKSIRYQKEYIDLTSQRKGLKDNRLDNHIAKGLGHRISIQFTGHFSDFIELLAYRVEYGVELNNLTKLDTPIGTYDYYQTTVQDILNDSVSRYDYSLRIDENERTLLLEPSY
ncbi:MAG: hypothetical protein HOG49_05015 [Candidatus Scalindua sp.]|jgi:hypothetical protein|nr:hypothetical protein [Candidatus Scalindua sp.]